MSSLLLRLSDEISAAPQQVDAAVKLLDASNILPFIARYRKETTGGLDDGQLCLLAEALTYLRELDERRLAITQSTSEQGKMTDALAAEIKAADSKARPEDLYLPYRQKRRTKAQIAREAGLAPLADRLLTDPSKDPEQAAVDYVKSSKNIDDTKIALDRARQMIINYMAEDADLLGKLREFIWNYGIFFSKMAEGASDSGAKFSDYFSYQEKISEIPSHRALALFRGRNENILLLKLEAPDDGGDRDRPGVCEQRIACRFGIEARGRPADAWLAETVKIDPKAIGVGQYQHDVDQQRLGRTLDSVVEDCVNRVGVDLNTASAPLLARVAGLGPVLARNIVAHRDRFGVPTVTDMLRELEKLGRDPRGSFRSAAFKQGVESLKDLTACMILEGVVTNATNFGAFVDFGVHQDGLVHFSALADRFVKDPHSAVHAGDVVKVKVLEVDLKRQPVALTLRLAERPAPPRRDEPKLAKTKPPNQTSKPDLGNRALAEAFARARQK
jgi:transcriptional accessory protein Tex/SPT6